MKRVIEVPLTSPVKRDDRGVRADSLTNQLRAFAKQKSRKRRPLTLAPLDHESHLAATTATSPNHGEERAHVSVQKQIQGPVSLQWLIDDFVQAACTGKIEKVDHYIRGGIPIDMKHSVLHQTALHASAALKEDLVTRHLVQAGANVDALTKDRESTLHLAARYHSVAIAKEVLRNNADLRVINKDDMLAVDIAADVQDQTMVNLLEPPPSPPSNVRATIISSTSLTISWSSHAEQSSSYQSRVSWVLSGSQAESLEICSGTSFRINNLMPAATYEICVRTGNHTIGWSASSDLLIIETDGDVPNTMAAPSITRVSDHSITMRIRLPPSNGSDLLRVSIQSQCTGSIAAVSTASFRRLLRSADEELRWESLICDASQMRHFEDDPRDKEHTVEGLLPGHVYYFRIKASNRYGWSPDGEVSDGICINDVPQVVCTTARSMTLVWTKPYSTELIDKYQVHARASYSTMWEIVADNVQDQRADIENLFPATAYCFRVVPHYASSLKWEDTESCACTALCSTHTTIPEPPPTFRVVDRTAHSVVLSWETPRCNGHAVEAYKVEYRIRGSCEIFEGWRTAEANVPVDAKTFTVQGLTRGQPYQFRVCARNARGESHYSHILDPPAWTYAFLPPTNIVCVAKTSFSLTIAWQDGTSLEEADAKTDFCGLQYEVQQVVIDSSLAQTADLIELISSTNEWVSVVDGLSQRQAVVSGLSPLGCYCFRVRARPRPATDPSNIDILASSCAPDDARSVFSPISPVFQTLRRM